MFCQDLLQKKGVLLLPGCVLPYYLLTFRTCYSFGNQYFRLGLGRKSVPEALQKVEEYLNEGHLDVLVNQKKEGNGVLCQEISGCPNHNFFRAFLDAYKRRLSLMQFVLHKPREG